MIEYEKSVRSWTYKLHIATICGYRIRQALTFWVVMAARVPLLNALSEAMAAQAFYMVVVLVAAEANPGLEPADRFDVGFQLGIPCYPVRHLALFIIHTCILRDSSAKPR